MSLTGHPRTQPAGGGNEMRANPQRDWDELEHAAEQEYGEAWLPDLHDDSRGRWSGPSPATTRGRSASTPARRRGSAPSRTATARPGASG